MYIFITTTLFTIWINLVIYSSSFDIFSANRNKNRPTNTNITSSPKDGNREESNEGINAENLNPNSGKLSKPSHPYLNYNHNSNSGPNSNFEIIHHSENNNNKIIATILSKDEDKIDRILFSNELEELDISKYNSTLHNIAKNKLISAISEISSQLRLRSKTNNYTTCEIQPSDQYLYAKILEKIDIEKLNLIEYNLDFLNYTVNPLSYSNTNIHKPYEWSRASSHHGQTLLSLAFNYGILSLMTLTFGTDVVNVTLQDEPFGCFEKLPDGERMDRIWTLLMRDFADESVEDGNFLKNGARICHEVIENVGGYAKFEDWCCHINTYSRERICENSYQNASLIFLYGLLVFIRVAIFFFGPLLFLTTITNLSKDEAPYTVALSDTLVKTLFICKPDNCPPNNLEHKHLLDFRKKNGFPKLKTSLENLTLELSNDVERRQVRGEIIKIRIRNYHLNVNYKRLLTENKVPIGLWKTLFSYVFFCKLRNTTAFQDCCKQDMFKRIFCYRLETPVPWIKFWQKIGLLLLLIFIPIPFYSRLLIFYFFEKDELIRRQISVTRLGLKGSFENSLLNYYLPNHFIFIIIYAVYIISGLVVIFLMNSREDGPFKQMITKSFTDLKNISYLRIIELFVRNLIWPLKKFGCLGCFVVLIYWPLVIPLTLVIYFVYCLPTLYLSVRLLIYANKVFNERVVRKARKHYRTRKQVDQTLNLFDIENLYDKFFGGPYDSRRSTSYDKKIINNNNNNNNLDFTDNDIRNNNNNNNNNKHRSLYQSQSSRISDIGDIDETDRLNNKKNVTATRSISVTSVILSETTFRCLNVVRQIVTSVISLMILYLTMLLLTECMGFFVDILIFTLMGIIVNAGTLLKYIALIIMILIYSYDSFNNVQKKYLKLNKALFAEVKSRIKDLDKTTSLPSYLQENRGFKTQENCEQAEYETPDDISDRLIRYWFVNDLVMFVDNEDMPRIPKKLFKGVCEIKVAGVPGPVYRGLMQSIKQFIKIVVFILFVFIVVLSFGKVYNVSNTNQMIAALAGGSLPFILRTFMEPDKPDIELGTVSFKSKLDEIIKNFAQPWPIYDFSFELYKSEDDKEEGEGGEDGGENNNKFSSKHSLNCKKLRSNSLNTKKKLLRKASPFHRRESVNLDSVANLPCETNKSAGFYNSENILNERKSACPDNYPYIACNQQTSYCQVQTPSQSPRVHFTAKSPSILLHKQGSTNNEQLKIIKEPPLIGDKSNASDSKVCFVEPMKSVKDEVDLVMMLPESWEDVETSATKSDNVYPISDDEVVLDVV